MKHVFYLFLIVVSSLKVHAQFGLSVSHVRPTGELGFVMKPTFNGEVFYKDFDEDRNFKARLGIGYIKFTPRQDTFPVAGYISSGTTTMTPGYMVYQKYNVVYVTVGADYEFMLGDKFSLYPGADVKVVFNSVEYQAKYPLISDEGYSGGTAFIGLRLRAGAQYKITSDITVFTEANRSMAFSPEEGGIAYNQYALGIRYNFSE